MRNVFTSPLSIGNIKSFTIRSNSTLELYMDAKSMFIHNIENIHTYIMGNYNLSVRMIDLVSHNTIKFKIIF